MEVFQIKLSSRINYLITFFLIIAIFSLLFSYAFTNSILTAFAFVLFAMATTYYITKITATVPTIWTVSKTEIYVEWKGKFIFQKERVDLVIRWDEIKAYKLSSDKVFDRFKLILKDGTIRRYWHDNLITRDDYDKFITYFIMRVKQHNQQEQEKSATPI